MSVAILESPNLKNIFVGSITIGADGQALQKYVQGSLLIPFTGVVSGNAVGLYRQIDRSYVISFASAFNLTGTGAGVITFSAPLPFVIWTPLSFPVFVQDGGTWSIGRCAVDESGNVTIYKDYNSNFTGTGNCGFDEINLVFASYFTG